jgi:hypothetical protein
VKCSSDASMSMPQHVHLAPPVFWLWLWSQQQEGCGVYVHCSMIGGEWVHHGGGGEGGHHGGGEGRLYMGVHCCMKMRLGVHHGGEGGGL